MPQIPCYVINLERNPERFTQISQTLTKQNISFIRINAVDGSKIAEQQYLKLTAQTEKIWGCKLSYGELGCFLSHKHCLELVAQGSSSHALIIEDDVAIAPELTNLLNNLSWLPKRADIIKLDTLFTRCRISRKQTKIAPNLYLASLLSNHAGAAGYIISKKAAQKLLTHLKSADMPIDEVFFHEIGLLLQLNVQQIVPALIKQLDLLSNLEEERAKLDKVKLKLPAKIKRELLRLIKQFASLLGYKWWRTKIKTKFWQQKQIIPFAP